jgi:hypothetical protein
MEDLKKYKIPLLIILPLAIVMMLYNYVFKKGDDSAEDPYMQNQVAPAPVQRTQPASSRPPTPSRPASNTARNTNQGIPGRQDNTGSRDKFVKYNDIVQEIYSDYEAEEFIYTDIRNYFSDFKLSNEMQKKAKNSLFAAENNIANVDKNNESLRIAKEFMDVSKKAYNARNYLKAEIFANKTNIEIEKIEAFLRSENRPDDSNSLSLNSEKGPTVTILYKGFAQIGDKKIAYLRRTESYSDSNINDSSTFLQLTEGDELILSDSEKYIIMSIEESEIVITSERDSSFKRNIPIDKGL